MKKIVNCFLLLLALILCLFSCTAEPSQMSKRRLDEFSPAISSYGLGSDIIPEGFIDKFNYYQGYFYYYGGTYLSNDSQECLFLFFQYDNVTYQLAKKYVIENLTLSENTVETYNNYCFYDNLGVQEHLIGRYPKDFVRFCYNDTNNILIFLGFSSFGEFSEKANELADDWGAFLEEFYGEWYDFSE